jgi:hypothetical protein
MKNLEEIPITILFEAKETVGNGDDTTILEERIAVKKTHGLSEQEAIKRILKEEGVEIYP